MDRASGFAESKVHLRIRVAQFDLQAPGNIWGTEGYAAADILVRSHGVPVGRLRVPLQDVDMLTKERMSQLAEKFSDAASQVGVFQDLASEPSISVVVCTRDRPIALSRCLASLQAIRYSNFEVLVVDNASRANETKELVAKTSFRYVREERPGLDWARNCGLFAARNDIVAYTDDDVQVDPDWLKGIAFGFNHPQVACVTGLVCPLELETPAQTLFEEYGGMGKGFAPRIFQPAKMLPGELIASHSSGVGANMAFRRDFLMKQNGFDVHLDVGTPSNGGGDLDVFHRTMANGGVIRYEPRALVWHQHRRSIPGLHKQIYNNGRAFGCYLMKIASKRSVARGALAAFAAKHWIGGWLIGSLIKGGPGRTPMLVAAEIAGALSSPWAYWKTYRRIPILSRVS
jgi:glycosyltransferase involved in cell wall biosynthesis